MRLDLDDTSPKGNTERRYLECPRCGARGGCDKHGLTSTGIDLRARGYAK
jgi:hypothetical protein